ncbi:hypothetical protein B0A55_02806 [Friedmanniomyces simplex]|uniref:Thioredoxin domain-containing protein n=1 Tax=Friedmanniomyces simplex TaxID=329884 RepID=A0A4U0XMK7_9PEZI|nr:hypothetical protein B0A55_02806 [Friedmanniomyces simplex]
MTSKVVPITSAQHFRTITSSSTYTIVDFYATWCGPCKVISPIFEQLASAESKPGRITFCKVDVDAQREVAGTYGISAMPTFLILKGSSVKETVRGANAAALRTAVLSAAADAAKGPAKSPGATFGGKGQTLGNVGANASRPVSGSVMPDVGAMLSSPAQFAQGRGLPQTVVRFLGLYFTSLFSLEPETAARESPFAVKGQAGGARVGTVR